MKNNQNKLLNFNVLLNTSKQKSESFNNSSKSLEGEKGSSKSLKNIKGSSNSPLGSLKPFLLNEDGSLKKSIDISNDNSKEFNNLVNDFSKLLNVSKINGNILQEFVCLNLSNIDNQLIISVENQTTNSFLYDEAFNEFVFLKNIYKVLAKVKDNRFINNKKEISNLEIINKSLTVADSKKGFEQFLDFYRVYGGGVFNKHKAFYLNKKKLVGVNDYDEITFDDIIGYEFQKNVIKKNIENFKENKLSHNMLLYGDQGTGKSSLIKAIINDENNSNIRIISVTKEDIKYIPYLYKKLSHRGLKFILFFDDLSFEEDEYEYKILKSLLEGRIEAKPKNIIFAVTSNRNKLINESFKARAGDDININDTISEKHSLASRFQVYLSFMRPNKNEYLNIVNELINVHKLKGKKIKIENETLIINDDFIEKESTRFERRFGGRNGRVAKQFIEYCLSNLS